MKAPPGPPLTHWGNLLLSVKDCPHISYACTAVATWL